MSRIKVRISVVLSYNYVNRCYRLKFEQRMGVRNEQKITYNIVYRIQGRLVHFSGSEVRKSDKGC